MTVNLQKERKLQRNGKVRLTLTSAWKMEDRRYVNRKQVSRDVKATIGESWQ
jgi:hypothetical protein